MYVSTKRHRNFPGRMNTVPVNPIQMCSLGKDACVCGLNACKFEESLCRQK